LLLLLLLVVVVVLLLLCIYTDTYKHEFVKGSEQKGLKSGGEEVSYRIEGA
jgi:hypothetical protein